MGELALTVVLLGTAALLVAVRVPVAFSLGLAAFAYFFAADIPALVVVQKIAAQLSDPLLMAIPFFVLTGEIMSSGDMARRLIDVAGVFVGFVRGGLAMVNIAASMLFGGISGSSVADTASLGSVLVPMMERKGYDRGFSVAVTVASSTQGIVIPPSHNAILYALAAGGTVSIQALFLAGYLPGALIAVALMVLSWFIARRRGYPAEARLSWRQAIRTVLVGVPALVTPLVIIVPISLGVLPAHHAAVIAVVWAGIVSTFGYRSLPWRGYPDVLRRTARTSSMVLILIGTAAAFGEAMTFLHVPERLTTALTTVAPGKIALLATLNVALLVLGMIMDMAPLIVILTPVLLPVVEAAGVDPVHFGLVLLLNLAVGLCTPPVGSTLFVGCAVGDVSIERATRALWPFYAVMVAVVLLVTYLPSLSLWLPELVLGD